MIGLRSKPKRKGVLVTFEGTEGAGKSTLIQALSTELQAAGYVVTVTREPGGTPVAEKIREVILHSAMNPWTELFLYEAARSEHLHTTILPALNEGNVVLCDRFTDSTLAYQGVARGLPWKTIRNLNRVATQGLSPALTIFLDIDPARGLRDAKDPNRFEAEGVQFQQNVRSGFLKAIREEPKRWLKVKARSGSPEVMAKKLRRSLETRIPRLMALKPRETAHG